MTITFSNLSNLGNISFSNVGNKGNFSARLFTPQDMIRTYVTGSSAAAYDAATINTWVKVTKAEYDNVATRVSSVTKVGATDGQIDTRLVATAFQLSQTNDFTITAGSYIFGMIIEPWNTNCSGSIGYTSTVTGSIGNYNNYFANNFVGLLGGQRNYYVLKKPTNATQGLVYPFVTMSSSPNGMNYKSWGWSGTSWQFLPASSNAMAKFQLLTTTLKQW